MPYCLICHLVLVGWKDELSLYINAQTPDTLGSRGYFFLSILMVRVSRALSVSKVYLILGILKTDLWSQGRHQMACVKNSIADSQVQLLAFTWQNRFYTDKRRGERRVAVSSPSRERKTLISNLHCLVNIPALRRGFGSKPQAHIWTWECL